MLELGFAQNTLQSVPLFLYTAYRFGDGELPLDRSRLKACLQITEFTIFLQGQCLNLLGKAGFGESFCGGLVLAELLQFTGDSVALFFSIAHRFLDRQLLLHGSGLELPLEFLNFAGFFGHGQLNGIAFVLLGKGKTFVELLFEIPVAHLFEDVGIACLVHLEGCLAVGADDVVHV